jgi:signal transduction histidine kinase
MHHGKRADAIVKGMLQHSQANTGKKVPTDINVLANEYLRLAYHAYKSKNPKDATGVLRTGHKDLNEIKLITEFDNSLPLVNVIPQDIGRVLLNLFNNAFWACNERKKGEVENGEMEGSSDLPSLPTGQAGSLSSPSPSSYPYHPLLCVLCAFAR